MPLRKGGKTAAGKRRAVQSNIRELYKANESKAPGKRRSRKQIVRIAHEATRG